MKRIEDKFYLEIGDIVYSTITRKKIEVIQIQQFGTRKNEAVVYFSHSAGAAYMSSSCTYFKSVYHSCIEIDESNGKGYIFLK